jgi:hypothetical protein
MDRSAVAFRAAILDPPHYPAALAAATEGAQPSFYREL